MTDYRQIYYPEVKFGGFTDLDGTIAFYFRVNSLVNSSSVVLDVGCGRGQHAGDPIKIKKELRVMKGKCKKVIGIDIDEAARQNPFLDEVHILKSEKWPLEDKSIDVCICDGVIEHVENPDLFFSECSRVVKPGGVICIRTPNLHSYVGLMTRLIPNRLHISLLKKVQGVRKDEDVFPTLHKCNTVKKLRRMLEKYGFDGVAYGYEAEPSYFNFSRFFFWLGVLHQKFAPRMFKVAIFGFGRKKSD